MLEVQHLGITMIRVAFKLEFNRDQTHEVAFGLRKFRLFTD